MSHRVEMKTCIKDAGLAISSARALKLAHQTGRQRLCLYSDTVEVDLTVTLPNWRYPIGIDIKTGTIHFDNYNGHWGNIDQLDDFVQEYNLQLAEQESQDLLLEGWQTERVKQANGDIQIQLVLEQGI